MIGEGQIHWSRRTCGGARRLACPHGTRAAYATVSLFLLLWTAGCAAVASEPTPAPTRPPPPTPTFGSTATPLPNQLYIILNEQPRPIENGERVELSEELNLQITVDPYPPRGLSAHAVVDLHLTRSDGQAVDNAEIDVVYDMFSMVHGPFDPPIIERTDGHYLFPLEMIMYGAWELNTAIRAPGQPAVHELTIAVILTPP